MRSPLGRELGFILGFLAIFTATLTVMFAALAAIAWLASVTWWLGLLGLAAATVGWAAFVAAQPKE